MKMDMRRWISSGWIFGTTFDELVAFGPFAGGRRKGEAAARKQEQ